METTGRGTAIVTPFKADESIDETRFGRCELADPAGIHFRWRAAQRAKRPPSTRLSGCAPLHRHRSGRRPRALFAGSPTTCTRTLPRQAALLRQVQVLPPFCSANPYYNSPLRKGNSGIFSLSPRPSTRSPLSLQRAGPHGVNLEPQTVSALQKPCPISSHQGSERQAAANH